MDYKYKETVTKENIEKDIKRYYYDSMKKFPAVIILTIIVFFISLPFFPPLNTFIGFITLIAGILLFTTPTVIFVYLIYCYLTYPSIYTVATSKLHALAPSPLRFMRRGENILQLQFNEGYYSTGGRGIKHYTWSSQNRMDGIDLLNCSRAQDEFYIILVKKKIICVYNKKLFNL